MDEQSSTETPATVETGEAQAEEILDEGTEETQVDESVEKPPKGYVPYQALEEERRERKELQEQIKNLTSSRSPEDEVEEGDSEVKRLTERLNRVEREAERSRLENLYPYLKDKKAEFNDYLDDEGNKNIPLDKLAKLFLAEQGQLGTPAPKRKGVETPTGGSSSTAPSTGLTPEDVEKLRTTDFRKYQRLVQEGKITFKD